MNLNKINWVKEDILEFENYLLSLIKIDKVNWTNKIINTKMPVLAILSPVLKDITKEIVKGNFLEFIELWPYTYYEESVLLSKLIMNIKDFETQKSYIYKQAISADNWATIDSLEFNKINAKNASDYYDLTLLLIKNEKPFARRAGIRILFKLIDNDNYINNIYTILDSFKEEKEYYVNMVLAWLLAELVTKRRDETLNYLSHNNLNDFVINNGIQKCRDSFRITETDKDFLLQYKRRSQ